MSVHASAQDPSATMEGNGEEHLSKLATIATLEGVWYSLNIEGQKKPNPRYEQGAAMLGTNLFVIGGNCAGSRYLNDVWVFDVAQLQWIATSLKATDAAESSTSANPPLPQHLPPCAGHTVTPWRDSLMVLGGHVKAKDAIYQQLPVRVLDTRAMAWSLLSPSGPAPVSRGGHSATLVGTRLFVFGGEDVARRVLGDLWVLDLATLTWSQPAVTGQPPTPRSTHAAVAYQERYICIFGGGSMASCFNDVVVLDTDTMVWSRPRVLSSPTHQALKNHSPTPRAGVAAALYGDTWYMVGGGNGKAGCTEMLTLDLSQLVTPHEGGQVGITWEVRANVPAKSSLSSEGISLHVVEEESTLVAFGGYNGKYHNAIALYRIAGQQQHQHPTPQQQPMLHAHSNGTETRQAAAAAAPPSENGVAPDPSSLDPSSLDPVAPASIRSAKDFFLHAPSPSPPPPIAGLPGSGILPPGLAALATDRGPNPMEPVADVQVDRDHEYLMVGTKAKDYMETKTALESARREAESAMREVAAAKEAAAHELALMRRQLTQTQAALAEAEKGGDELRSALSAEQARSMRAEAELGEARVKLAELADLEKEVEKLRRQIKEAETKKSGGVFGFLSG